MGPKVKIVKSMAGINHDSQILIKKTKTAESAFCGSPECFHLETTFTPGEPP